VGVMPCGGEAVSGMSSRSACRARSWPLALAARYGKAAPPVRLTASARRSENVRYAFRVDLLESYSNLPDLRRELEHLRLALSLDGSEGKGLDGKVTKLPPA
jgi:hypothetical protein